MVSLWRHARWLGISPLSSKMRCVPLGFHPQAHGHNASLYPPKTQEKHSSPPKHRTLPHLGGGITGSAISYLSLPSVGGRSALTFPAEAEAFPNHDARAKKVMDLQHKLQSV